MPQYNFDVNAAMQAGYTPDQIQAFLAQQKAKGNAYQLAPTPQATPQQSQQPAQQKSNWLADALPTVGSIVGGVAGAALPVLGETGVGEIGGAAVGSGLGETAKELIEGQPLSAGNIAGQTVVGGVGGVAGKGLSYVAGKVLPSAAEGAASRLMNSVYKEPIKATKASISKGESLGEQALQRGQSGTTQQLYDKAVGQISNSEDQLQNVLMGATKKVAMSDVEKEVAPLVQEYMQSGNTEAANAVTNRIAAIKEANGDQIPAALANQIKRSLYDEADKAYGQQSGTNMEGIKAIAKGLKNSIENTDPQVAQINKDLSFYGRQRNAMLDKMSRDQRNSVLGLNDTILAAGGAAGAGPVGITLPLAKKALATTYAKTTAAQTLNGLASSPVAAAVGNTLAKTVGQGAARTLLPMQPSGTSDQNNNSNNPSQNNLPPTPQGALGDNSTIQSSQSQAIPASPGPNPLAGYTLNAQPIDPATANLVYKIANYQIDPTKITSLKNDERERVINLVSQYDPTYDSSQFPVKQKLRDDYTSGTTGKNIQAFNTAIQHLNLLNQVSQGLGNSSFTPYNAFKNNVSQVTGDPKVTNFNQVANAVSGEIAKIFKSSGATDAEISNIQKGLSADMSPAQLQGNINYLIQLMGGKLDALNSQYEQAMGKPADFQIVDPRSQAVLQSLQSNPNSLPATP